MTTPHIPHNETADKKLQDLPEVLTVKQLANALHLNIKTVYEAIHNGEIPGCRRIGRNIRISRKAVINWFHG